MQKLDPALIENENRCEQWKDFRNLKEADEEALSGQQPLLKDKPCEHTANSNHNSSSIEFLRWQMPLFSRTDSISRESPNSKTQSCSNESPDAGSAAPMRTKQFRVAAGSQHSRKRIRLKEELRERNRIAAAKHRKKKRKAIDSLDANLRSTSMANAVLRRQTRELRDQLARWRMLALEHGYGEDRCECAAIQRYNLQQASEIVLEAERRAGGI